MNKPLTLSLLIFFSCLYSLAQEEKSFDLILGDEFVDLNPLYMPNVFGLDKDNYYVFQENISHFYGEKPSSYRTAQDAAILRKFDKDLKLVLSKKLVIGKGKEAEKALTALGVMDQLFLYSFRQDKGNRKHLLFSRPLNKEDFTFPDKGTQIAEVSYDGYPHYKTPDYHIQKSRDSSKILLHFQLPTNKGDNDRFGVHVFSEEMQQLWMEEFKLPYPEEKLEIQSFQVGNDGRVFVLTKYKESKKKKVMDHVYKLFVLNPGFEEADEYDLEIEGKPLANMMIQIEPDGDVLCVGSYMVMIENGKESLVRGFFFFRLNGETLQKDVKKIIPYPEEMLEELIQTDLDKLSKASETDLKLALSNDIIFQDIIFRSDGGMVLLGEVAKSEETIDRMNSSLVTLFIRYGIIAVNFGPNGELEDFEKVLVKYQSEKVRELNISYGLAVTNDKLRFLFSDNIENESIVKEGYPKPFNPSHTPMKKQTISMVTFDQEGNSQKEFLMSMKDVKMYHMPRLSIQTSDNEMILFFENGKMRRLGKLTFK